MHRTAQLDSLPMQRYISLLASWREQTRCNGCCAAQVVALTGLESAVDVSWAIMHLVLHLQPRAPADLDVKSMQHAVSQAAS